MHNFSFYLLSVIKYGILTQFLLFSSECDCDKFGSESCDKETGKCMCKPNVIGDRCDQCAPDTWGFLSGYGCSHCNCSIASNSSQCDIITGTLLFYLCLCIGQFHMFTLDHDEEVKLVVTVTISLPF